MRIGYPALMSLLLASAAPTNAVAQVLTLPAYPYPHPRPLEHAVPVATVSLVGDVVTLEGARVVQDAYGEPFVLGAATLNLNTPSQPRVVFTMTNGTEAPIPLRDVLIYERTMVSAQSLRGVTVGAPFMPVSAAGWGPGGYSEGEQLQPGASLTVEVPLSPFGTESAAPSGFVVFVGRKLPHGDKSMDPTGRAWIGETRTAHADASGAPAGRAWLEDNPLFTRAFLALLSQGQLSASSPF
jgi:hypothetical protein